MGYSARGGSGYRGKPRRDSIGFGKKHKGKTSNDTFGGISLSGKNSKGLNLKNWFERNYYGEFESAMLESTEEQIENLTCPLCDGDVEIFNTADYGESATHPGQLISIDYECKKCNETFSDGLHVTRKVKHI